MIARRYVVQGIPLAQETRDAWKYWGWTILRSRAVGELPDSLHLDTYGGEDTLLVMNAGMSQLTTGWWEKAIVPLFPHKKLVLFNPGEQISMTRRPGDLRETMEDLLPPIPECFPVTAWLKGPGHGGERKTLAEFHEPQKLLPGWDMQAHVEGQEYRAITVMDKVVQVFERHGDLKNRDYTWVGVENGPSRVIGAAKRGAARLEKPSVIAWDIMLTPDKAYILEANTAPGMSEATARRITTQIDNLLEGDTL